MKEDTRKGLTEITTALGEADKIEKRAKKVKENSRATFFVLANIALQEDRPLRKRTIITKEAPDQEWIEREYPEWRILTVEPHEDDQEDWHVVIEENPAMMKFSFVNSETMEVYGRTTSTSSPTFDAEGLWRTVVGDDAHELAREAVSKRLVEVFELDELRAQMIMTLHPETKEVFEKFTIPGTLSVKLTPIRKAKEEEID